MQNPFDIEQFVAATAEKGDDEANDPNFERGEGVGDEERLMNKFSDRVRELTRSIIMI
jgi:hypothetical protein